MGVRGESAEWRVESGVEVQIPPGFVFIFLGIVLGAILKSLFIFISSIYILPLFLILNNIQKNILGSAFSFIACISAILGGILAYWINNFRLLRK